MSSIPTFRNNPTLLRQRILFSDLPEGQRPLRQPDAFAVRLPTTECVTAMIILVNLGLHALFHYAGAKQR